MKLAQTCLCLLNTVGCFNLVQTQSWTPGTGAPAGPCPAHLAAAVDVPKVTGVTIVRFPRYDLLPALKLFPTRILKVVSPRRPGPLLESKAVCPSCPPGGMWLFLRENRDRVLGRQSLQL